MFTHLRLCASQGAVIAGLGIAPAQAAVLLTGDAFIDPATAGGATAQAGTATGGTIAVTEGSTVSLVAGTSPNDDLANPSLLIGDGANGDLVIEDAGSTISLIGNDTGANAVIGNSSGTGTGVVRDGGALRLSDPNLLDGGRDVYIDVGRLGGLGELTIDNGELSLNSNSLAGIGLGTQGNGDGTLILLNGALASIESTGPAGNDPYAELKLGRGDGSSNRGALEITDSTLEISAAEGQTRLLLGENDSFGQARVAGAAASVALEGENSAVRIGDGDGALGRMTVTEGAFVTVAGTDHSRLAVGSRNGAFGELTISDGADVAVTGPAAYLDIGDPSPGAGDDSTGIVEVTGAGSRLSAETDILVGAWTGGGSTTGILSVSDGGEVETPFLHIADGGFLTGSGGIVTADVLLGGGGTIAPGLSPGVLTIDGDLELGGGTLEIEIAGDEPGLFDRLEVLGDIVATSAFGLELVFLDDYAPGADTNFEIFSASSIGDDVFEMAELSITGVGGRSFSLSGDGGSLSVRADLAPIPLPLPALGLITSLALLGAAGRRRLLRG